MNMNGQQPTKMYNKDDEDEDDTMKTKMIR